MSDKSPFAANYNEEFSPPGPAQEPAAATETKEKNYGPRSNYKLFKQNRDGKSGAAIEISASIKNPPEDKPNAKKENVAFLTMSPQNGFNEYKNPKYDYNSGIAFKLNESDILQLIEAIKNKATVLNIVHDGGKATNSATSYTNLTFGFFIAKGKDKDGNDTTKELFGLKLSRGDKTIQNTITTAEAQGWLIVLESCFKHVINWKEIN